MADLAQLSVKQLRLRADELGVDRDRIEAARDGDDPRNDLIALIRAATEPKPKVQRIRNPSCDADADWLSRLLAGARLSEHLAKFRALNCADAEDVRCMGRETLSGIGLSSVEVKRLHRLVGPVGGDIESSGAEQLVVQAKTASQPQSGSKARCSCGVLSAVAIVALLAIGLTLVLLLVTGEQTPPVEHVTEKWERESGEFSPTQFFDPPPVELTLSIAGFEDASCRTRITDVPVQTASLVSGECLAARPGDLEGMYTTWPFMRCEGAVGGPDCTAGRTRSVKATCLPGGAAKMQWYANADCTGEVSIDAAAESAFSEIVRATLESSGVPEPEEILACIDYDMRSGDAYNRGVSDGDCDASEIMAWDEGCVARYLRTYQGYSWSDAASAAPAMATSYSSFVSTSVTGCPL